MDGRTERENWMSLIENESSVAQEKTVSIKENPAPANENLAIMEKHKCDEARTQKARPEKKAGTDRRRWNKLSRLHAYKW